MRVVATRFRPARWPDLEPGAYVHSLPVGVMPAFHGEVVARRKAGEVEVRCYHDGKRWVRTVEQLEVPTSGASPVLGGEGEV